jgi:hypothetical protein
MPTCQHRSPRIGATSDRSRQDEVAAATARCHASRLAGNMGHSHHGCGRFARVGLRSDPARDSPHPAASRQRRAIIEEEA